MNLVNTVAVAGSLAILGEYLDRKLQLAKDLQYAQRLVPTLLSIKKFINNDGTVADIWEETCRKFPNKPAIVFEGKSYSFKQMDEQANRLAHWAASKGLKKGDVVALYMENRPEYVIVWLGLSKIGCPTAMINCNLQGKGLIHCIKVSEAKALIFGHESAQSINDARGALETEYKKIDLYSYGAPSTFAQEMDSQLNEHSPQAPPRSVRKGLKATDTWAFVYTSGTTGLPKAAVIKHLRFASTKFFAVMYNVTENDRLYTALPLYHSAGGMIGAGIMLSMGTTLVLRRKFSASQFIADIQQNDCTAFQYIGELCRYLLATPPSPNDTKHKLRVAIGNGLRPDIWEQFQTRFAIPRIGEFYSATEGNVTLFNEVGLDGEGRGAIGRLGYIMNKVIPTKIIKFDVAREEPIRGPDGLCILCGPNEPGELIGLIDPNDPTRRFDGYYGNKAGTEKKILKNAFKKGDMWFRSGDLLRQDEKGYFYFCDRIGDTFRWKGENVSTTEVAEVISVFPGVKEVNVYGVEVKGADGRAGMAAIVADDNLDYAQLGAHVTKDLPPYAVPVFLRKLPEIEITGTFKHRKVELRDQGYDPASVPDPLFFFNPATKAYEPFGPAQHQQFSPLKAKL